MNYIISNKKVNLTDRHYKTEGGEGKIYIRDNTVYKIYIEPRNMIPLQKIKELQVLDKPNILTPLEVIYDSKRNAVGITMNFVDNTKALCKFFSTGYRNKIKFGAKSTLQLVETLQQDIRFIHSKNCLVVDLNDFNILIQDKTYKPYFIDTTSYKTPNFPPTAIMPSIRDWRSNDFTEETDWFSFGILACQLFVGIHPYKGHHSNFKKNDFRGRILANMSIFNREVSIPSSTRDFSNIPTSYYAWFNDLFEKGKRIPPPLVAGVLSIIPVKIKVIQSTNNFEIKFIREVKDSIIRYNYYFNTNVVITPSNIWIGKINKPAPPNCDVFLTKTKHIPIAIYITNNKLQLHNLKDDTPLPCNINVSDMMVYNNTLYILNDGKFTEMFIDNIADRVVISTKMSTNVLPKATQMLRGMVHQDILGKVHLTLPYTIANKNLCITKYIKELNSYRIMDGKHDNRVCIFIVYNRKTKDHDRIILRFDENYRNYSCRIIENVDYIPVNFTVLSTGIVVSIIDDGELELFTTKHTDDNIKVIKDPDITTQMSLCKKDKNVYFFTNTKLYELSMKRGA